MLPIYWLIFGMTCYGQKTKISKLRRGERLIYRTIFPLRQMLSFLNQAVERIFQVVYLIC